MALDCTFKGPFWDRENTCIILSLQDVSKLWVVICDHCEGNWECHDQTVLCQLQQSSTTVHLHQSEAAINQGLPTSIRCCELTSKLRLGIHTKIRCSITPHEGTALFAMTLSLYHFLSSPWPWYTMQIKSHFCLGMQYLIYHFGLLSCIQIKIMNKILTSQICNIFIIKVPVEGWYGLMLHTTGLWWQM